MADPVVLDTGVMTHTMNVLLGVFEDGAGNLSSAGAGLLSALVLIEIVWAGLMWAFGSFDSVMQNFIRKIVHVGVFAFLVINFTTLANVVLEGFMWAGLEVGGGRDAVALMRDPSGIVDLGFAATETAWADIGIPFFDDGAMAAFLMLMVSLMAMLMYFAIALQVFVTLIEFYIIATFGVIYVPWGVNKNTSFIAERYFGAVLAQGTKVMVLSTLVAVLHPVMSSLALPPDPTLTHVMSLFFGVATIAYVVKRAPEVAGGLMAGSASLSFGDMTSAASAFGGTAAGIAGVAAAPVTAGTSMAAGGAIKAASAGTQGLSNAVSSAASASSSGGQG